MKLFRKKVKHEKQPVEEKKRSVVFINRTKKLTGNRPVRNKGIFFTRRIFIFGGAVRKLLVIILLIGGTAGLAYGVLFLTSKTNNIFISPLPNGFVAQQNNDTEKKLAQALKKQGIIAKKVTMDSSYDYHIFLQENGEVVLSGDKEIAEQIASLQFILNRLTMEGRSTFKRLDLRFEKPVITFK